MSRIRFNSKQPLGLGGRILGSLFFFVFLAMGAVFCVFIGRECFLNLQMRHGGHGVGHRRKQRRGGP